MPPAPCDSVMNKLYKLATSTILVGQKRRSGTIVCLFLILVLLFAGCAGETTTTQPTTLAAQVGSSLSSAAPIGVAAKGIVECGYGYTSHELYDVRVTMLEVKRGDEAYALMTAGTPEAPAGSEYIVARVKFEYNARGAPGDCCHELKAEQFVAFSENGGEYPAATVPPPDPELKGRICAGNVFEGWVVFQVAKDDKKPAAMFDAGAGGVEAIEHGGNIWFQLY